MADVSKVKLNGTAYNIKDASVPSWAKQSSKPSYTQDEVGDGSTYKRVTSTEKSTWNNKGTYSKPSGGIPKSDLASAVQTSLEKADTALQSFTESDPTVPSWAKQSSKPSYTASEVGAIATSAKGAANGVASLDSAGKVPSSQLPSYVDDVLEYSAKSSFPSTGETGKIYVDTTTNKTYRWSGSAYVEISASLALGETSSTAYRGDKGKTAYEHATDSSRLTTAQSSGLYKIATTAQGHIASVTAVAKSDITNLGIPGSDTNTHRPIQVNGTQVLGDNTTALNLKAGSNVSLSNSSGTVTIAATDTTYSVVSTSGNGLAPKVTDTSKFLKGDGTWATPANTWTAMVGATSSANGSVGYVNAVPPKDGYNTKYLRADGSWSIPPNTTYSAATQSANGLMSSTDKKKLDGIATGAQVNSITGVKGNSETTYRTGNVNITAANIGLGNVGNFKAVSTVASQGLSDTEKSNARANIGAAASTHIHGSINHDGTLNTTPIGISNGDRMLITSAADNNLICTGVEFDGSTATQALTKKGTWETFNNYLHPTTSGNKHIPSGGSSGQILRWSADGTAKWGPDNNTWTAMVGATSSANGSVGYVNAVPPKDGYNTKYLRADGSWQVPPNTTYSAATTSAAGLMSAADKTKLNGIATGATANIGTVTQVKVGSSAYNPSSGVVSLPAYPTTLPASDVYSWAKAATKPSYTVEELGLLPQEIAITAGTGFTVGESFSYKCNNLAWFSIMIKSITTLTGNQTYICAYVDANTIKRGNSPVVLNAMQDESFNRINAYFSQWSTQEIKIIPENNVPADTWIFISGVYRFY